MQWLWHKRHEHDACHSLLTNTWPKSIFMTPLSASSKHCVSNTMRYEANIKIFMISSRPHHSLLHTIYINDDNHITHSPVIKSESFFSQPKKKTNANTSWKTQTNINWEYGLEDGVNRKKYRDEHRTHYIQNQRRNDIKFVSVCVCVRENCVWDVLSHG